MRPVGGHEVDGFNGTECNYGRIATAVAGYAHALHRQIHGEGLAGFLIPAGAAEFFNENVIGEAQRFGGACGDFTQNAHAEARSGERVAVDHLARQAKFQPNPAHFVLEQLADGLNEFQLHMRRQATHVVVAFDDVRFAGFAAGGFDDVGVDGALREKFDVAELGGFLIEDFDKEPPDDFSLLLRIANTGEFAEVALGGVHADHAHAEVLRKHPHDFVAFLMPQQAVVDKHAGELLADRLVQQRRDHRGIHAARQPQQHMAAADLRPHAGDGVFDDVVGGPAAVAAANIFQEALVDPRALRGVRDFGMELQRVVTARFVGHPADRQIGRGGDDFETRRQFDHAIAVAHPHVQQAVAFGIHAIVDVAQELTVAAGANFGVTKFVHRAGLYLAAKLRGHGLHAVANAEHRHAGIKHGGRCGGRSGLSYGFWSAGENDAGG